MLLNAFQDVKRPLNLVEQKLERVIRICINEQVTIFIKTRTIFTIMAKILPSMSYNPSTHGIQQLFFTPCAISTDKLSILIFIPSLFSHP